MRYWMFMFSFLFSNMAFSSPETLNKTVYLEDNQGKRLAIASISFTENETGTRFELLFKEAVFGDFFLSMRPFRCIDLKRLYCSQPYPYGLQRTLQGDGLRALEYDLLFISRKEGDYGIDAYNGRYYILEKTKLGFRGKAHGVDLNILAAPPEKGFDHPIGKDDLDEMEPQSLLFPMLIIE